MSQRLTKNRQVIADIVDHADLPLSAQDIYSLAGDLMDQATVYRSLQFLEDKGFVDSFTFECHESGIMKYYTASRSHVHFLHCESCHRFFPVEECSLGIPKSAQEMGFAVHSHTVHYRGLCKECLKVS